MPHQSWIFFVLWWKIQINGTSLLNCVKMRWSSLFSYSWSFMLYVIMCLDFSTLSVDKCCSCNNIKCVSNSLACAHCVKCLALLFYVTLISYVYLFLYLSEFIFSPRKSCFALCHEMENINLFFPLLNLQIHLITTVQCSNVVSLALELACWIQLGILYKFNPFRTKTPNIYYQEEINLYCIIKLATGIVFILIQISKTWCFVQTK